MDEQAKKFLEGLTAKRQEVDHPTLGKVYVRELTLGERLEMERAAAKKGAASRPALLIAAATFREDGRRVFEFEAGHAIDELPTSQVTPLSTPAGELNNLTPAAEASAEGN